MTEETLKVVGIYHVNKTNYYVYSTHVNEYSYETNKMFRMVYVNLGNLY